MGLNKLLSSRASSLVLLLILLPGAANAQPQPPSIRERNQSSENCGFPNYCAYTGQALSDPFQWNPNSNPPAYGISKAPNVGNLSRKYKDENGQQRIYGFRDTSYLNSSFKDVENIPYVYRCTDAYTEPGRDPESAKALTFSPAIGNSGSGLAWNANSTLLHLATPYGNSYIIQYDPSDLVCADRPLLQSGNISARGSSIAQEFGGGGFLSTDPSIWTKKRPDGTIVQFQINWTRLWQPRMKVNVGDVVAAVAEDQKSSCFYLATVKGVSGNTPPAFPTSRCGTLAYTDASANWLGLENRLKFCADDRHPHGAAVAPGQWCRLDDAKGQPIVVADFRRALPIREETAPPWQPAHVYHFGDYVSVTLSPTQLGSTVSSSLCQTMPSPTNCGWKPETQYNTGDLIRVGGCAYKVVSILGERQPDLSTNGGITGKSKPNFSDGASSPCNFETYPKNQSNGSVVWLGLGGPARFAFQLVSSTSSEGGVSGSAFPTLYTVCRGWPRDVGSCEASSVGNKSDPRLTKHPDFMSFASDSGLIWVNVGPFGSPSSSTYSTAISLSADGRRFGEAFSTNTYGSLLIRMPYAGDIGTEGQQGTGIWAVVYDKSVNGYFLYNTGTGIISKWSCTGASDAECTGGKWNYSTIGRPGVSCREGIHSFGLGLSGRYAVVTTSTYSANAPCMFVYGKGEKQATADLNWNLDANPSNDPNWAQDAVSLGVIQHIATGDRFHVSNMSGLEKGTYGGVEVISNPQMDLPTWIVQPCDGNSEWLNATNTDPPCYSGWFDMHMGWADNADGTDDVPACGSHTGYSSSGMNPAIGIPYTTAYANEAVCFPTRLNADAPRKAWRFSHTFHSQSNLDFDTRFAISSVSQDGRFFAWPSDWTNPNGTGSLGSSSGDAACRGGYPWRANHYYPAGAYIAPNGGMMGNGNLYGVFQAQNSGTSGKHARYPNSGGQPPWLGVHAGVTVQDNGVIWKKLGPSNCRGDVFIANISGPVAAASIKSSSPTYPSAQVTATQPLSLKLRNRGASPLVISSITVKSPDGSNSRDFSETNDCGSSLEPGFEGPLSGQACTITVTRAPGAKGAVVGTLTIVDNGTDSPQTLQLSGEAGTVASRP